MIDKIPMPNGSITELNKQAANPVSLCKSEISTSLDTDVAINKKKSRYF